MIKKSQWYSTNLRTQKDKETQSKGQYQEKENDRDPNQSPQNFPEHHNVNAIIFKSRQ